MDDVPQKLKTLEIYLPLFTSLIAIVLGIVFLIIGQGTVPDKVLLWSIFGILVFLAGSEGLKRLISIKNIEDSLKDISESHLSIKNIEGSLESIAKNQSKVTNLISREALYLECAKLVRTAQHTVCDTTWGKSPETTLPHHTKAREIYRTSISDAIKRGVQFKEIFSYSDENDIRKDYIKKSIEASGDVLMKLLQRVQNLPLIEFMVIDSRIVLFSRVYSTDEGPAEAKYYLVEDEGLGKLFQSFFNDMWKEAVFIVSEQETITSQIEEVEIRQLPAKENEK